MSGGSDGQTFGHRKYPERNSDVFRRRHVGKKSAGEYSGNLVEGREELGILGLFVVAYVVGASRP